MHGEREEENCNNLTNTAGLERLERLWRGFGGVGMGLSEVPREGGIEGEARRRQRIEENQSTKPQQRLIWED